MCAREALRPQDAPNLSGHQLGSLALWTRHRVCNEDTMAHLALKYGTTIGQICRANRLHWQDILQTRSYIWLPVPGTQQPTQEPENQAQISPLITFPNYGRVLIVPPHFYRQSAPNLDDFAGECDPLLITTRCM
ncbi:uncharacterized protein LOC135440571 [Drosophila montana]|uniref:uncharacterized protein LOC135440571 n=1 Tax=Drosophila montana TaxID=40370 RepID=UPI00313C0EEE